MEILYITLSIIFVLVLIFFLILYFIYRISFYNNLKKQDLTYAVLRGKGYDEYYDVMYNLIDKATKIEYEKVSINAGKTKLSAKYYFKDNNFNTAILFHGYKGNSIRDMSGGLQYCLRKGLNVLLVDQRSHGESSGRTISFGVLEKDDVKTWVDYINEFKNPNKKDIILMGISMGAATVIMSTSLNLSSNVKCVIADCPYSDQLEEILAVSDKYKISRKIVKPLIILSSKVYGGFDIDSLKPIDAVRKTNIPILIIHGTNDSLVNESMSKDMKLANPNMVSLIEVDNAEHGVSYIYDKEKYESVCDKFLKNLNLID